MFTPTAEQTRPLKSLEGLGKNLRAHALQPGFDFSEAQRAFLERADAQRTPLVGQ